MTDDLNLSMFRAYDIRTPSRLLPPKLAERLFRAEARYFLETLRVPGVILAHDARLSGPGYLSLAADILRRAGLHVACLPGPSSASHFYFTAMQHPECAGVMIGASHNPTQDTGCKILGPGVFPIARHIGPEGGLDRIRELYVRGEGPPASASRGSVRILDNLQEYVDFSMALAGVKPGGLEGVRLLHDYLFGSGGREMIAAFERAGARLDPLHFVADGNFPLGDPNPVKQAVTREGRAALKSGDYLLGTFFDGDADRIDFYAGDGRYLSSSFVYAGILPQIRKRFPGDGLGIFADLKSNPLAVIEMAKTGLAVEIIRNGHSQIKAALYRDPRMIGAVEESAHFYEAFPPPDSQIQAERAESGHRYCTENTLYIALLVTRTWWERPERFEELLAIQSQTSREREWGHRFPSDEHRARALEAVQKHFESLGAIAKRETNRGLDLEATMMRRGLPFEVDQTTRLADDWLQVCQRISQSENHLARWEVVAATPEIAAEARAQIIEIARRCGGGEPYQG